jgi:hypothetical protein
MSHRKENALTQERLKEVLHYDPDTGIFTWLISPVGTVPAGSIAGCRYTEGYIHITIDRVVYRSHRLAFLYMEGYFPEYLVDHIDRNPSNNAWTNLREVSNRCNCRNRKVTITNKSGVTGVFWYAARNKWLATIKTIKKNTFLGYFTLKTDAVKARWEAEVKYGFPDCNTYSSAYLYLKEQGVIS